MSAEAISGDFGKNVKQAIDTGGRWEKAGRKVAGTLYKTESRLIELAGKDRSKAEEKEYAALQIKYQRAQRGWQMFQQVLRNMHEMAMTAIRNLRFN